MLAWPTTSFRHSSHTTVSIAHAGSVGITQTTHAKRQPLRGAGPIVYTIIIGERDENLVQTNLCNRYFGRGRGIGALRLALAEGRTLADIKKRGKLTVGTEAAFEPFK